MEGTFTQHDQDAYLLSALRQGDPAAFKLIYNLHWIRLYNLAYYYVTSEQDAEDIVQDVFISLWSRREKLELKGPIENYLIRCAKYTTFFYLKIRQRNSTVVKKATTSQVTYNTEEYISYRDLQNYLISLFESVSQKTKEIFFMSRFDGLTYPEIAGKMGISVKTVEYHISQALKMLTGKKMR